MQIDGCVGVYLNFKPKFQIQIGEQDQSDETEDKFHGVRQSVDVRPLFFPEHGLKCLAKVGRFDETAFDPYRSVAYRQHK